MSDCVELLNLRRAARRERKRSRAALGECQRLRAVTGLGQPQILRLDLVLQALDARQTACAALVEHAARHGCGRQPCRWPRPCEACGPVRA